jgi:hypothetical protein
MDRDTRIWAIVLAFVLLLILVIVTYQKNQDYQIKIAQLETELAVRKEETEKEIEEFREIQKILLEENSRLKEKLKRYETLSNYMEERLKTSNPGISDEEIDEIITVFWEQTNTYGFEPEKALAWIEQESSFRITAVSYKGAVGLTQIMPATGKEMARKMNIEWRGTETLMDPELNLRIGFYYLNWCKERPAVKTEHQIFSAYFWGIGNLQKKALNETVYSREIMDRADQLRRLRDEYCSKCKS